MGNWKPIKLATQVLLYYKETPILHILNFNLTSHWVSQSILMAPNICNTLLMTFFIAYNCG